MRKTRILASLLCIMMIVCALPVMQVSAATADSIPALAPSNLGTAAAEVMNTIAGNTNKVWARPLTEADLQSHANCNLDFADSNIASDPYLTVLNNSVTFGESGAVFGETQGIMRYYPGAANPNGTTTDWSPVTETGYYVFSFKLNEGGSLSSRAICKGNYTDAVVDVTPEGVTMWSGTGAGTGTYAAQDAVDGDGNPYLTYTTSNYAPGTEWNDVLIYMTNTYNPYQVWMKKSTDSSFVKIGEARYPANMAGGNNPYNIGFGNDYTSKTKGCTFIGTNVNVGYAASYKGVSVMPYSSMEEILGGPVASTYAFDFDANSNFENSSGRTGFTVSGITSDADGMTQAADAESSSFKFAPFGSYSPLHGSTNWGDCANAADYDPQALYFKAKGNFTTLIASPRLYGRIEMPVTVGTKIAPAADAITQLDYYLPLDEWTEYLIVPNQRTAGLYNNGTGYSIYVKAEKGTNGDWWKIIDQKFKNSTSSYGSYGLTFNNITGHIKNIRVLSLSKNVTDAAATPANATYAYVNEEFDAAPTYSNTNYGSATFNGNMVFPTTKGSMDYKLMGQVIPVGGYAEFKVQYDGVAKYVFYDGAKQINIGQQSDYNTVTGGYSFHGANNTAWKTWRILRTEAGYDMYVKADGDTGWTKIGEAAGTANTTAPHAWFNFGTKNGSNTEVEEEILVGDSKLAYLKVYGPAPESALTLTDGYTGTALEDGATISYPASLRAIVTEDAGKLLVVSYIGDNMAKAQIVDVADMVDDNAFVDATATDATKVKVFLWGGFDTLNNLAPAVTLNL